MAKMKIREDGKVYRIRADQLYTALYNAGFEFYLYDDKLTISKDISASPQEAVYELQSLCIKVLEDIMEVEL